jgi:hypothetical protein
MVRISPATKERRGGSRTVGYTRQEEQSVRAFEILSLFQPRAAAQKEIRNREENNRQQRENQIRHGRLDKNDAMMNRGA